MVVKSYTLHSILQFYTINEPYILPSTGLPHLIADPGLALRYGHTGDVLVPTVGFLYVAGWIGYSGTKYIQEVKGAAKPIDKEIIIDVPLAWKLLWAGLGWPVAAVAELRNKTLLEADENITVSPR